jgi:hypothetical protein
LDDGRLFGRWQIEGSDGLVEVCREYDPKEDPLTAPRPPVVDWSHWHREQLEKRSGGWFRVSLDDVGSERARFAREWPEVAEILGIGPDAEWRLFDVGEIQIQKEISTVWRPYVLRHMRGDYGLYGSHPDDPVNESEAWTISVQPPHVQARHAVDTGGRGVIRSRHLPADREQATWPPVAHFPQARRTIDITTIFGATTKKTLAILVTHNIWEHPFEPI